MMTMLQTVLTTALLVMWLCFSIHFCFRLFRALSLTTDVRREQEKEQRDQEYHEECMKNLK